jgi:CDP-diacylglycerol--glycerol-3-phosphate 3-phosphatidyltransferase
MPPISRQNTLKLAQTLLKAARGQYQPRTADSASLAGTACRAFPLHSCHIGQISSSLSLEPPTPSDFHGYICQKIRSAQHRVYLASLYVGAGTGEKEDELLDAISNVGPGIEVKILLDANRALRPVPSKNKKMTSSAKAVYQCLKKRSGKASGLYLFQALPEPRRLLLPSPLNEVAGVFHIKAYIVDDELILSGANLSEEYFVDRQDRYVRFCLGGGGLVDLYVDLVNALCHYGEQYRGSSSAIPRNTTSAKIKLRDSLVRIMDGTNNDTTVRNENESLPDDPEIVAYAVPTFQAPEGFFSLSQQLPFLSDAELTRTLLLAAHEVENTKTSVQLSSAYLNPTEATMKLLSKLKHVTLLTAGPKSHGFAPKPGRPRRGDFVPEIFSALYSDIAERLDHADLLFYERPGWTFHAKGLLVHCQQQNGDSSAYLAAAMVGSGNFGARSEVMDVESNCILVFPQTHSEVQTMLEDEWESMCQHATREVETGELSWKVRAALPFIRDLF